MTPLSQTRAARLLPPPEFVLNHVVNRIPYVAWRMAAYRAFGVSTVDPSTGILMLRTEVWKPSGLTIGRRSIVGRSCLLDARGGIMLGDDVNVSSFSRFMTAKHITQDPEFDAVYEPAVLGDRVWLGMGVTVLGGVTIGEGTVVAANATVTRDLPPFVIAAGTPAVPIGKRRRDLTYRLGYRPNWL